MSFRDTFTRSSTSNQNLQYDDTAAYHFLVTILLLISIPLFYSIIKPLLNPFSFIPKLKQIQTKPQFKDKVINFKKQNRFKFITFCYVISIIFSIVIIFGLFQCYLVLRQRGDDMKGFDPYQILQVSPNASIQQIKKSYRKLALKYHPDRNHGDPQANAKFIMISKSYQCLTNQAAKQNCLKYGNPQGTASFNVGIALPTFLVKKQNQVIIMSIVFIIVVIVLPIFLIYYFGQVNKYDQYGMLQQSHQFVHSTIHQQLSIKDCVFVLGVCSQFKNLKVSNYQIDKLNNLLKQYNEQDTTKHMLKKKYPNYIKKTIVLINTRLNSKSIPQQLYHDYRLIIKTIPILIKSIIMMALTRSNQFVARFQPEIFVGGNAITSLIIFSQYFIQGKSPQHSKQFQQLDLTQEQIQKIYKKKKKKQFTLHQLITDQTQKKLILSYLPQQRVKYIQNIIEYFPIIQDLSIIVHTAGEQQITTMDNIQLIIKIKSNRKSNFCSSINYPFLKMQGWWLLVLDKNIVVHLQQFNFNKQIKYQTKFYRGPYRDHGHYSLTIKIFSDCYYGLDIQQIVKFTVTQPKKIPQHPIHQEKQDLDQDQSLFGRIMKFITVPQDQELSDTQDQNAKLTNKKNKNAKEQTQPSSEQQHQKQTNTVSKESQITEQTTLQVKSELKNNEQQQIKKDD